jgi:hypothetical protein
MDEKKHVKEKNKFKSYAMHRIDVHVCCCATLGNGGGGGGMPRQRMDM